MANIECDVEIPELYMYHRSVLNVININWTIITTTIESAKNYIKQNHWA